MRTQTYRLYLKFNGDRTGSTTGRAYKTTRDAARAAVRHLRKMGEGWGLDIAASDGTEVDTYNEQAVAS